MNSLIQFNVPSIEDSFIKPDRNLSMTERYFTPRYALRASGIDGEDHCILFHSNKICIITLAPSHPVLALKKTINKIDFEVSTKLDRTKNKVSGKGKHGAQFLQPNSALCFLECSDGSRYTIFSCIQGKLIEVNENLSVSPNLLTEHPTAEGYIAVVLPNIGKSGKHKEELLTQEEYENAIKKQKGE